MRRAAAIAALAAGLLACGLYGPPERAAHPAEVEAPAAHEHDESCEHDEEPR